MYECVSPPSFLKSIFVVNILNGYGPGGARGWVWFGPTTLSTWQFKSSFGWLVVSKYFPFQAFLQEVVGLTKMQRRGHEDLHIFEPPNVDVLTECSAGVS